MGVRIRNLISMVAIIYYIICTVFKGKTKNSGDMQKI